MFQQKQGKIIGRWMGKDKTWEIWEIFLVLVLGFEAWRKMDAKLWSIPAMTWRPKEEDIAKVEKDKSRPLARPDKCYRKVSVSRRGFSSSLFRLLISVRWRWRKREIRRRRIVVVYLDIDGYWLYLSLYIHYIQISLWSISLSRFFSRQRDNAHRFEKDWAERRVPAHLVPEAGPPKVTIPMMVHRVGGCWFG